MSRRAPSSFALDDVDLSGLPAAARPYARNLRLAVGLYAAKVYNAGRRSLDRSDLAAGGRMWARTLHLTEADGLAAMTVIADAADVLLCKVWTETEGGEA